MFKIKNRQYISGQRFVPAGVAQRLAALISLGLLIVVSQAVAVFGQTVTQGYASDQSLRRGMIVKLKQDDTSKVEPVEIASADQTLGVVVDPNDAPVTLSEDNQKIFVASNGQFDVLVTDQQGAISAGDLIAISALPGIGMKAGEDDQIVVGKTLDAFNGIDSIQGTVDIQDSSGNNQTINIGRVKLAIGVAPNPLFRPNPVSVPGFLKTTAETITNKPVSAVRIYTGLAVFLVSALIAGSLLYVGVRSSITAVGRNPLSRHVIGKSLLQVSLISIIILLGGVFAVYLLLKL